MRSNLYYRFNICIINLLILSIFFFNNSVNANKSIDKELKDITSKLRCMTCQNQDIYSSEADFSKNIKKIVRDKLEANESKKEIINFLVYRYGEYIIFEPKMDKKNSFLWFFPFIILAISLVFLTLRIRKGS